ncbi:GNS1/SUR4 family protein [Pelomyxa schiedti]|nr:GNS1/SUR4 family protein [Pelomyxa schiedti]
MSSTLLERILSTRDKRVENWPLNGTPTISVAVVFAYAAILWYYTSKKKPSKAEGKPNAQPYLRFATLLYDILVAGLNLYIGMGILREVTKLEYSWVCNDFEYSERTLALSGYLWWFFVSKHFELLDTIIMLVKNNLDQVTVLHVYHHLTMPLLWWIGSNWVALGDAYWSALVNSFVHVIMYSYYALAAVGFRPSWKRALTSIQMTQFVLNIIHSVTALVRGCGYIPWMHWGMVVYMLSLLFFFGQFYLHAYNPSHKKSTRPHDS